MPTRLIREGLLDSERVCAQPLEARWLFVTICLIADDVGIFDAAPFALMRKAELQRDLGPRLLTALADVDLIRIFTSPEHPGKQFGFVPRYGQRLRITKLRHPLPPLALVQDDPDAARKIKYLTSKMSADGGGMRPEAEAEAEAEAEGRDLSSVASLQTRPRRAAPEDVKRKKAVKKKSLVPPCPYDRIVAVFEEVLPEFPKVRLLEGRKPAIRSLWSWVLTSTLTTGKRRATTVDEGLTWFKGYFERVRKNDFLMGRGDRSGVHASWRCDLDYLLTQRGLRQVIEKTAVAA